MTAQPDIIRAGAVHAVDAQHRRSARSLHAAALLE
jgi:hypothetical protein